MSEKFGLPQRKSMRLRGYDYTIQGAYFVTICTAARQHLFGEIVDGEMRPSTLGSLVYSAWNDLPNHHPHVELDAFVLMPNHLHGIVVFAVGAQPVAPAQSPMQDTPTKMDAGSLGVVIRSFKASVTRKINRATLDVSTHIWQRNYYDHIIRNEADLNRIRESVMSNPERWQEDRFYGL